MPISADELRQWAGNKPVDFAQLEGGERLKFRFVAFLAAKHPQLLQQYLFLVYHQQCFVLSINLIHLQTKHLYLSYVL